MRDEERAPTGLNRRRPEGLIEDLEAGEITCDQFIAGMRGWGYSDYITQRCLHSLGFHVSPEPQCKPLQSPDRRPSDEVIRDLESGKITREQFVAELSRYYQPSSVEECADRVLEVDVQRDTAIEPADRIDAYARFLSKGLAQWGIHLPEPTWDEKKGPRPPQHR